MAGWIISGVVIPVCMILCGFHWWKHTPQNINGLVGYRTGRSMKNKDTWIFANQYAGKRLWTWGWVTLAITVAVLIPFIRSARDYLGTAANTAVLVQAVVVIEIVYLTQKALAARFDENGHRIGESSGPRYVKRTDGKKGGRSRK
jgi:uncharacterized membrane protein